MSCPTNPEEIICSTKIEKINKSYDINGLEAGHKVDELDPPIDRTGLRRPDTPLMIGDGLLGILLVGGKTAASMDLVNNLLAIE